MWQDHERSAACECYRDIRIADFADISSRARECGAADPTPWPCMAAAEHSRLVSGRESDGDDCNAGMFTGSRHHEIGGRFQRDGIAGAFGAKRRSPGLERFRQKASGRATDWPADCGARFLDRTTALEVGDIGVERKKLRNFMSRRDVRFVWQGLCSVVNCMPAVTV